MGNQDVSLKLTRAEALVLFEWLARHDTAAAQRVEDSAERKVLWNLEGQLEKALQELFDPNYSSLVEDARRKVRGTDDT